ncbi:hypothetical protein [Pseudomonas sp. 3-2]|uniref:hypothetical protein n=1 Tax=Pseudomonas sp. 3-2 TaxID=2867408 RepID=UPI001C876978|nr:hypothetical protein [Pseudomonas sp. 3-2]QZD72898.1 hypothetical protein K3819_08515 [Pseudomonas sp. 3-2]
MNRENDHQDHDNEHEHEHEHEHEQDDHSIEEDSDGCWVGDLDPDDCYNQPGDYPEVADTLVPPPPLPGGKP